MPKHHLGLTSTPPQGAATGDRGSPAPPTGGENLRPEETPNATNPKPVAAPSPTRRQTLHSPVPTRERNHPLTRPGTGPATDSHQDYPAQPGTPETPINHPAMIPASAPAPARAPRADAPTRAQHHGPDPATPQPQAPKVARTLRGAHRPAATAQPTAAPTTDGTQAVTSTTDNTPPGPHGPGAQPGAKAPDNTGALPTPPPSPRRDDPTGNSEAGPQETAEGDSRRRLEARRAALMARMSSAEMKRMDRDLIQHDTDEELDSGRSGMEPPGTIGVSIRRHETDAGTPGDPGQPIFGGAHWHRRPATIHNHGCRDPHRCCGRPRPRHPATARGLPGTASTAQEAPCPHATHQPEAGMYAVRAPRGTAHTDGGRQGPTCTTNGPLGSTARGAGHGSH